MISPKIPIYHLPNTDGARLLYPPPFEKTEPIGRETDPPLVPFNAFWAAFWVPVTAEYPAPLRAVRGSIAVNPESVAPGVTFRYSTWTWSPFSPPDNPT